MSPIEASSSRFEDEVEQGKRFEFGENWKKYLSLLNEDRISEAEHSLKTMLGVNTLKGLSFVDIGSGSGLFSLAARRLGATVRSFDYDPSSVWCTNQLRQRYYPADARWTVEQGSILDQAFVKALGRFDIAYSWGVLHHTGDLWRAVEMASGTVTSGGKLFIGLYNDQGRMSRYWLAVKKTYCRLPGWLKPLVLYPAFVQIWGPRTLLELVRLTPFRSWRTYAKKRGMSPWRDVVDWVGGYPFEVSRPDQVFAFLQQRGFELRKLATTCDSGINQFVFERVVREVVAP